MAFTTLIIPILTAITTVVIDVAAAAPIKAKPCCNAARAWFIPLLTALTTRVIAIVMAVPNTANDCVDPAALAPNCARAVLAWFIALPNAVVPLEIDENAVLRFATAEPVVVNIMPREDIDAPTAVIRAMN